MSSVIESMPVEILTEIFSSLPTFYDLRSLVCSSRVLGSIWQANRRPICAALLFRDPSLLHKHGKLTMLVELCPHVCGPGCCKTKVFHKAAVEIYQAQQASLGTEVTSSDPLEMVKIVRTNALAVNRTADTLLARIRSVKDVPDLEGNHNLLREFLYRIWFVHASPPMELLHDPSLPEDQNELLKIMCGYMMRYPEVRVGFPDVVRLVEGEEFHWFGGNSDKLRLGINLSMVWSNKAIELIQMAREHVEKRKTSRS